MGLIHRWARIASSAPGLVNAVMQTPGIRDVAKWVGGIAHQRRLPAFASQPFTAWHRAKQPANQSGDRVLLWPDTLNNHFRAGTAIAAAQVLESAGFHVTVPDRPVCCGRALYDWGMLDTAKRLLHQALDILRSELEAGTPVIVLEPACLPTFKDEMPNLIPGDSLAQRLERQSVFFSEFVAAHAGRFRLKEGSSGRSKVMVQTHCHHHAVIGTQCESDLLGKLRVDHEFLPSGCCGMAGAFGFAADTYDVAMAAGERVLLPAVRAASPDTLMLADGFSCREQELESRPTTWQTCLHHSSKPVPARSGNRRQHRNRRHRVVAAEPDAKCPGSCFGRT